MSAPIQVAATFDSSGRRKDRSVSLKFSTTLEISTDDYAVMDRLVQQSGWLLFSPNELAASDIPHDDAPSDTKKPSVRLRGVIWHIWDKNTDRSEPFDLFYQRQMDRIIEKLKEQLE